MGTSLKGKNLLTEVSDEHVYRITKFESNCNFNVFEYFSMNLAPGLILIAGVLQKTKKESPQQQNKMGPVKQRLPIILTTYLNRALHREVT